MQVVWLLSLCLGLGPSRPSSDTLPPGGYWRLGERREPEPNDGHDNLVFGGIMASLGLLRTGSGAVHIYISAPSRCADIGRYRIDPDSCPELRGYGWAGAAVGAVFLVTGVTMMAIGGAQRRKHQAWKRRYGIAVAPALGRDRVGAALVWRF